MANKIPPVPHRAVLTASDGRLTLAWADFFKHLFIRVGEFEASTNTELAARFPVQTADIGDSQVTLAKFATDAKVGRVVQDVFTQSGAVATGTTTIPYDDSIPQQSTEGTLFLSRAITPQSATNRLVIEAVVHLSSSAAARYMTVALFQDSTADAIAAVAEYVDAANGATTITLRHEMAAGTTSATTFKIHAGTDGAATVTFNGNATARRFGGITVSSLRVSERVPA
jgi:hypothetical protein